MMFCVGCGKKGVRWPKDEPIACTMRCLAEAWLHLSEASGGNDGEYCFHCGEYLASFRSQCPCQWTPTEEEEEN